MKKSNRTLLRKILRGAAYCAGLILILMIALALFPDSKGGKDKELLVTEIAAVPPGKNSHDDLMKLESSLRLSTAAEKEARLCVDNPACKMDKLTAEFGRNAETLRRFDAFRGKRFHPPGFSDPSQLIYSTPIPKIMPLTLAFSLTVAQARWLARQGRRAEALERLVRAAEVGNSLQSEPVTLLPYMLGLGFKIKALKAMRELLEGKPPLPSAAYKDAIARLRSMDDGREGFKHALRMEYTMAANTISNLNAGTFDEPEKGSRIKNWIAGLYFKRNRTRGLLMEDFLHTIGRVDAPCPSAPESEPPAWQWAVPQMLRGNLVGVILHQISKGNFDRMLNQRCEGESLTAVTEQFLALRRHK